ncbi:hypothetical protein TWF694_008901 [Orbilia ellipsospora]|uniref:Uncharacterized protein n=1 Tax=Orbilia ellipsospora TaxID=2528407 RepID=A0AAV9XEI2_9PEZI
MLSKRAVNGTSHEVIMRALNFEISSNIEIIGKILTSGERQKTTLEDPDLDLLRELANSCTTLLLRDIQCRSILSIRTALKTELSFLHRKDAKVIKARFPAIWTLMFDRNEGTVQLEREKDSGRSRDTEVVKTQQIQETFLFLSFSNWREEFCFDRFKEYGRPTHFEHVTSQMKDDFQLKFQYYLASKNKSDEDFLKDIIGNPSGQDLMTAKVPSRDASVWSTWIEGFSDSEYGIRYSEWPARTMKGLFQAYAENAFKRYGREQKAGMQGKSFSRPARISAKSSIGSKRSLPNYDEIPASICTAFDAYTGAKCVIGKNVESGKVQREFYNYLIEECEIDDCTLEDVVSFWNPLVKRKSQRLDGKATQSGHTPGKPLAHAPQKDTTRGKEQEEADETDDEPILRRSRSRRGTHRVIISISSIDENEDDREIIKERN